MENNLRSVVNKIEQAVRSVDYNMGSFFYGDIYNINHLQEVKYPAVIVTNSTHTSKSDYITYNFNIFYVDRLTADKSNKLDVQSVATISLNNALQVLDDEYIVNDNWEIHTFEEKFNDVCAGAYINIGIQCPIELCTVEIPNNFYSLTKVTDYLYKGTWDLLDYNFAYSYFKGTPSINLGACSSIRVGNYYGRNFDWKYSELADVIVNTGYVLGVCGGLEGFTAQFIDSKQESNLYKILPFFLQDGINKDGLVMSLNVVPKDKGDNSVVNKSGKNEVCSIMLVRYILDRCKTVDEAISELYKIKVFTPASLDYDLHYMIADENKTVVVEFIDGEYNFIEHNKLTNFHISGVEFLDNGKVFTQYQISGDDKPSKYGITPYASGLERYNLMVDAELSGYADVRELMNKLYYTNAYSTPLGSTFWYSEFVGNLFTTDTTAASSAFKNFINAKKTEYNYRERDGKTWQTTHSSIYSFSNKKLRITTQEGEKVYEFDLGKYYPLAEVSVKLYQSATIDTPEDYYGISKVDVEVPEIPLVAVDETYTDNGEYIIKAKEGEGIYEAKITVDVPQKVSIEDVKSILQEHTGDIVIPEGVTEIRPYAFYQYNYNIGQSAERVIIPNTVTTIGTMAFNRARIKHIEIPNSINTWKGNSELFANSTLETAKISWDFPYGCPSYLFQNCKNLRQIIFNVPMLREIGNIAFNGCISLEEIDFSVLNQVPTLTYMASFTNVPTSCKIKVPASLYDKWITSTNWSNLYSQGYEFIAI